jgi:hypothetical protein
MKSPLDDRRRGYWFHIRQPVEYQGTSDKDVREWTEPLSTLRARNPELYKKVMAKHLFEECIEFRENWLNLKYPRQEQSNNEFSEDIKA